MMDAMMFFAVVAMSLLFSFVFLVLVVYMFVLVKDSLGFVGFRSRKIRKSEVIENE